MLGMPVCGFEIVMFVSSGFQFFVDILHHMRILGDNVSKARLLEEKPVFRLLRRPAEARFCQSSSESWSYPIPSAASKPPFHPFRRKSIGIEVPIVGEPIQK